MTLSRFAAPIVIPAALSLAFAAEAPAAPGTQPAQTIIVYSFGFTPRPNPAAVFISAPTPWRSTLTKGSTW